ncbi:MAG: isocitrate lyase/PEP mutase family protein [Pseudomonadota bacterium]|nr:isocitrate lyase/PEP mutase family protein [Pseudomonadota bacterium]
MRFKERREKFRAIMTGKRCVHPGSVFDAISARIAEDIGFEMGMFAGSVASQVVLGAPDHIVVTMTEFAEQCRRICRAGQLPLMVDADHCYGNALNVMRTVEELETAGICGMSIEDTLLPMAYSSPRKADFISIDEGVGKMKAALAARRDKGLTIVGRTSMVPFDLKDGIARVKAYEKAGVDALFLVGVKTRADLEAVAAEVKLPLVIGGSPADLQDLGWLSGLNVRVCLQGHQPFMAAVQAVHDTLKALRDGVKPGDLKGVASGDLMKRVMRDGDYDKWINDYLGG